MNIWQDTFPKYCQRNLYNSNLSSLLIAGKLWSEGRVVKGRQLELFCNLLQEHYNCTVFLTGSGRSAIALFLQALNARTTNRNVLLPFYICPSVPDAVISAGFKPVFLPIRRDLTMDPSAISLRGAKGAAAIIIPHIYGYPAATEEIISRVKSFNSEITILDDAAAAFNVSSHKRPLGSFGDAGVLSFAQGKLLNASGGGALLVYNPAIVSLIGEVYDGLPQMSSSEKLNEFFQVLWRFGLHRYSDPLAYWFGKWGRSKDKNRDGSHCMANLDAALALAAIPKISVIHQQRYAIITYYLRELQGKQEPFLPQSFADGMPPVSRLYFGFQRCRVKLDKEGQIVQHNPLYVYLRQEGIKTFYPYLPVKRYLTQYECFWENNAWLYSLLGLPVDFKRPPHQYEFVVKKILSFIERNG